MSARSVVVCNLLALATANPAISVRVVGILCLDPFHESPADKCYDGEEQDSQNRRNGEQEQSADETCDAVDNQSGLADQMNFESM